MQAGDASLLRRFEETVDAWGVLVEETKETESARMGFGARKGLPVVVKVFRRPGDEWNSGAVLEAFGGRGTVRVYDYMEGAVLLERLRPGFPLTHLVANGRDDEATGIIAHTIAQMSAPTALAATTVEGWGKGFERYRASGDTQVPAALLASAEHLYSELCWSQQDRRLLHGDLHHDNILFDDERGWVAIDPKGVIGEREYEIGASLRNPMSYPNVFASLAAVQRRIAIYGNTLKINTDRALAWCFSQAVLSAIWSVEDGFTLRTDDPVLLLANAVHPLFR